MKKAILAMFMACLMLVTTFSAISVSARYIEPVGIVERFNPNPVNNNNGNEERVDYAVPVPVNNNNGNEERVDFHFYVSLLAWSHGQIPADGASVSMIEYDPDKTYPDLDYQEGYTDEEGYIVLHPYLGRCYLIYVNYHWPKYEIALFSIQEVQGNNCFNVFLLKRHPFLPGFQSQPSEIESGLPSDLILN